MASSSKSKEEDLSNVEFETSEEVEVIATFDQMNLREDLLRGIYAYGEARHTFAVCLVLMQSVCLILRI